MFQVDIKMIFRSKYKCVNIYINIYFKEKEYMYILKFYLRK